MKICLDCIGHIISFLSCQISYLKLTLLSKDVNEYIKHGKYDCNIECNVLQYMYFPYQPDIIESSRINDFLKQINKNIKSARFQRVRQYHYIIYPQFIERFDKIILPYKEDVIIEINKNECSVNGIKYTPKLKSNNMIASSLWGNIINGNKHILKLKYKDFIFEILGEGCYVKDKYTIVLENNNYKDKYHIELNNSMYEFYNKNPEDHLFETRILLNEETCYNQLKVYPDIVINKKNLDNLKGLSFINPLSIKEDKMHVKDIIRNLDIYERYSKITFTSHEYSMIRYDNNKHGYDIIGEFINKKGENYKYISDIYWLDKYNIIYPKNHIGQTQLNMDIWYDIPITIHFIHSALFDPKEFNDLLIGVYLVGSSIAGVMTNRKINDYDIAVVYKPDNEIIKDPAIPYILGGGDIKQKFSHHMEALQNTLNWLAPKYTILEKTKHRFKFIARGHKIDIFKMEGYPNIITKNYHFPPARCLFDLESEYLFYHPSFARSIITGIIYNEKNKIFISDKTNPIELHLKYFDKGYAFIFNDIDAETFIKELEKRNIEYIYELHINQ